MSTASGPAPATTDPTEPRRLRVSEPSELLAESRLAMGTDLRDSLVLIGHGGTGGRPLFTRTDLRHLAGPAAPAHLEHHLSALPERGHGRAVALFVLGDGHDPLPPGLPGEAAGLLGAMLLRTAREHRPRPVRVDACWVLGAGIGHRVLPGTFSGQGEEVMVSPPCPLVPFAETVSAARAVLEGTPVPAGEGEQETAAQRRLSALGRALAGSPALISAAAVARATGRGEADEAERAGRLPAAFAASRTLLHRAAAGSADPDGPPGRPASGRPVGEGFVTDCEPLAELVLMVGIGRLDWHLFALCVGHGRDAELPVEDLLDRLVEDPGLAPHPDVCAGGDWFRSLERLRLVCEEIALLPDGPASRAGEAAWRGATAVLTLLCWWNHRFASAGDLVDELLEAQPDSSLAPLLSRLIDIPISPAWRPGP